MTTWQRMKGLLGRKGLHNGHGLWIRPCKSIHTFFMKFPIDVIFVSDGDRVVEMYHSLRPFRMTRWICEARSALELPSGVLVSCPTEVGDQLIFEGA